MKDNKCKPKIINWAKIFFNNKGLPENNKRGNNSTTFHIALKEKQDNAVTRKENNRQIFLCMWMQGSYTRYQEMESSIIQKA